MFEGVDPLELAALRLAIGEQPAERLPGIATDSLVRGVDSPSLREAAGMSPNDVRDTTDIFEKALAELGIDIPSEHDALWRLIRYCAEQIVDSDLQPREGAGWIWQQSRLFEPEGDLRVFIGLASEWDDNPSSRSKIDAEIVEEARELLGRSTPRRWLNLRAAQGFSPLWQLTPNGFQRNFQATDVPIEADLINDLAAWSAAYVETFVENDVEASGFETDSAAEEFVENGERLVTRLQATLGPAWHVEYTPEAIRPPGLRLRTRRPADDPDPDRPNRVRLRRLRQACQFLFRGSEGPVSVRWRAG